MSGSIPLCVYPLPVLGTSRAAPSFLLDATHAAYAVRDTAHRLDDGVLVAERVPVFAMRLHLSAPVAICAESDDVKVVFSRIPAVMIVLVSPLAI